MVSSGVEFPRDVNVGHIHFNTINGLYYRYLGGIPTDSLNWVIFSGATNSDPDTTGWTTRQDGAFWFNKVENTFKSWNGTVIVVVGSGGSGSSTRWLFHCRGTEMSIDFGFGIQVYFVVPVAGTITRWGFIVGTNPLPEDTEMVLYLDPFDTQMAIDTAIFLTGVDSVVIERVVSQVVAPGDVIGVIMEQAYDPADHSVALDGFVDFVPN